ncbi:hypothetical protein Bca4012_084272 [Brassica carinata]
MGSDTSVNNGYIINIDDDSDYDDYSNPDPTSYYRNISLRYFAAEPQEMLTEHTKLKELCLENGNPEAHYIEGILQYFVKERKHAGLRHLRLSSILNNSNGTFLYGLLMLVHGHYHKGKKYLDKFKWEENLSDSNHCWERIKNSLSSIPVTMTTPFYTNIVNLRPWIRCHPDDSMSLVCNRCYYYKRAYKWYLFATNQE